jgi:hypothetical protein
VETSGPPYRLQQYQFKRGWGGLDETLLAQSEFDTIESAAAALVVYLIGWTDPGAQYRIIDRDGHEVDRWEGPGAPV